MRHSDEMSIRSLAQYLATVRAFPRQLAREQERELARTMHAGGVEGEAARSALFEAHLWYAAKLARAYVGPTVPHDDLIQVANLALWRVLPGYDLKRRTRVVTYVTPAILADLQVAAGQMAQQIHRPRRVVARERKLDRLLRVTLAETGHAPSPELIAAALDVPVRVAQAVLRAHEQRPQVLSLEALQEREARSGAGWSGPEGRMSGSARRAARGSRMGAAAAPAAGATTAAGVTTAVMSADHGADPSELVERAEVGEQMRAAVAAANLTARQREVVALVYGRDLTLEQVARQMQVSYQAVWMHHERALRKIKAAHERISKASEE